MQGNRGSWLSRNSDYDDKRRLRLELSGKSPTGRQKIRSMDGMEEEVGVKEEDAED